MGGRQRCVGSWWGRERWGWRQGEEQILGAVALGGAGVQEAFDFGTIGEANGGSRGVDGELVQKVAGEGAGIGGEERLELADVLEGAPVGELAAGVNSGGEGVAELVSGAVQAGDGIAFLQSAIASAPPTEHVEVFQGEAVGIELGMAGGTALGLRMQGEEIADGFCAADVGFDGGNTGGRRRRGLAKKAFCYPGAADHRRGGGAIGGDFEDGTLSEDAAVGGLGWERDFAQSGA